MDELMPAKVPARFTDIWHLSAAAYELTNAWLVAYEYRWSAEQRAAYDGAITALENLRDLVGRPERVAGDVFALEVVA